MIAIGAPGSDGDRGSVEVYTLNEVNQWTLLGSSFAGQYANGETGRSVSLVGAAGDSHTVAFGTPFANPSSTIDAGAVDVFGWIGVGWIRMGESFTGNFSGDNAGTSVSLASDGLTVAIGAPGTDENGVGSGRTMVYEWDYAGAWRQLANHIEGVGANSLSGRTVSVSSDGKRVAVAATSGVAPSGYADIRIYDLSQQ